MIKSIVSTAMPVDEKLTIQKNCISNGESKKRVCIVTGTHGDELEGQYVCFLVVQKLRKHIESLNGTVEVYTALNPLGIDSIMRGIPNFDLDMNRIFPGDKDGSMAEVAAYKITEDLKGADMVIDIHSSNLFLREIPQVRINENDRCRLVPYAKLLNVDFIWIHQAATVLESTLAHSLNSTGTPCLVVEMGVGQRINHAYCQRLATGIFHLLSNMGMWSEAMNDESYISSPVLSSGDEVSFINAESSGIFITEVKNNIIVDKDEPIGAIIDPLSGSVLQEVRATAHGLLFTIRAYPVVYEGSLLARIHRIEH